MDNRVTDLDPIFQQYNIPDCLTFLECDGATNVLSQVLQAHGIEHSVKIGYLHWQNRSIFHLWIDLPDGCRIDFKARMWAGPDAPEGIFDPLPFNSPDKQVYYAETGIVTIAFNPMLAGILAGIDLEKS